MKLSQTEIAAISLTILLVAVAGWMAWRVPEPEPPAPIELADLPPPAPTPAATPAPRGDVPAAPATVPVDAFRELQPGLSVAILKPGAGPAPTDGQIAVVEFALWTSEKVLVDASHGRDRPFRYLVGAGQVIAGWERAISKLGPGGTLQARIAPELGYGEINRPATVAPDTTLILDLTLVAIEAPRAVPDAMPRLDAAAWRELRPDLAIADLTTGAGTAAADGLVAHFDHTIWLADGTLVDSSLTGRAPVQTQLGAHRMVPGFEAGMIGMMPGGKRLLRVGPSLAFGAEGLEGKVPPNATVIVELRLTDAVAP